MIQDLLNLAVSPLVVPDDGCSHTQPVERLIKKITKVAKVVYSADRREQYVRAQEKTSALRGKGRTKDDFGMNDNFSLKGTFTSSNSQYLAGLLDLGD